MLRIITADGGQVAGIVLCVDSVEQACRRDAGEDDSDGEGEDWEEEGGLHFGEWT